MISDSHGQAACTVLRPRGDLAGERAAALRGEIAPAMARGPGVVIDMSEVAFVDSEGLGALVSGLKAARQGGRRFALCALRPHAEALLEVTRLRRVFEAYPDVESAFAAMEEERA